MAVYGLLWFARAFRVGPWRVPSRSVCRKMDYGPPGMASMNGNGLGPGGPPRHVGKSGKSAVASNGGGGGRCRGRSLWWAPFHGCFEFRVSRAIPDGVGLQGPVHNQVAMAPKEYSMREFCT